MELKHQEITDRIIKTYYEVYNELGYGFLEKVYQNAMYLELKNKGFTVEAQKKNKSLLQRHLGWRILDRFNR
ncbi:GxxExxY protein [Flavobacterium algicola]|uniref:GxxExxY protein n=1 Tax=Flavobacterium algicola TaxID=556529 RepID=UPI001EFE002C|nr:GxxExxY protein [Flavobacterium algicola]MCG9792779.1 GxxExxY protein [Flavobacterium algicola]